MASRQDSAVLNDKKVRALHSGCCCAALVQPDHVFLFSLVSDSDSPEGRQLIRIAGGIHPAAAGKFSAGPGALALLRAFCNGTETA
jgi:hypothetical protein